MLFLFCKLVKDESRSLLGRDWLDSDDNHRRSYRMRVLSVIVSSCLCDFLFLYFAMFVFFRFGFIVKWMREKVARRWLGVESVSSRFRPFHGTFWHFFSN